MGIWNRYKKKMKQNAKGHDHKDITYPEDKGKITVDAIKQHLKDIDDALLKEILVNGESITLIYLTTLIDKSVIQRLVYDPLNSMTDKSPEEVLPTAEVIEANELPSLIQDVMSGYTVLIFPNRNLILKISTFSAPQRSVTTSENETTVIGPQESLTESLETNLSLIKRRIRSHHLKSKSFLIGTETRSKVSVLFMENIANPENVERVLYRVKNIEYQGFIGLAVLKQMLEDKPYSPFPQFLITSRPDFITENLMDGRVVVMIDGGPEAAVAPASFFEMFISPEDLYNRWTTATLLRSIRFLGFFITIMLTSTYISVLTYHYEMLPPALVDILSESRAQVPFPPVIEVLLMELVIEILREAGVRMPTKVGQTLGIVGGIVIGTAAVEAGVASNILIVLVAISALLSFLPTNYLMANGSRIIRYIFICAAGAFGILGQMMALAWLIAHLSNMTSLGTPYFSPIPRKWTDLMQSMFRAPIGYIMSRKGLSRAKKEMTRPTNEE